MHTIQVCSNAYLVDIDSEFSLNAKKHLRQYQNIINEKYTILL